MSTHVPQIGAPRRDERSRLRYRKAMVSWLLVTTGALGGASPALLEALT
jgi:hypothetical protein